jgi:hypothetical protein
MSLFHVDPEPPSAAVEINETHARLDDAAQMAAFLAPIPNSVQLGLLLQEKKIVSTRAYEDEAMVARFVRCNGEIVACYTVREVTIDESEMIAAQCELLHDWNIETFSGAVHLALDPDMPPPSASH